VTGWVPGVTSGDVPVKPEIEKMHGVDAFCLYGSGEADDPCHAMAGDTLKAEEVGTGHHFGGEYSELAAAMLAHAGLANSEKAVQ
jgi:type IV secretory pathway VirJ component